MTNLSIFSICINIILVGTVYSAPTSTTTNTASDVGRWVETASLAVGGTGHTSTLLPDGRVITLGGNAGGNIVEFYNSTTRTWNRGPSMLNARSYHSATLLPDGRLFVTGGYYYNAAIKTAEIYNPVSNTWTSVSNMNSGRYGHQAVYLPSPMNKILIMGGYGGDSSQTTFLQSCELYDFVSNKWTTTTPMINARVYFSAEYLLSMNMVVAIGGGGDNSAEMFDVSTLKWTRSLNTIPLGYRSDHTVTLLPNGQFLIAGGGQDTIANYLFDPTTKLFRSAANITQGRITPTATLLPSGSVLLSGGMLGNGVMYRSAEIYDFRFNTWRSVADMNIARFRHTSVVFSNCSSSLPTTVLVIAGQKDWSGTPFASCELLTINA
ncbi:unnamed protein product [Adineta ricciae]|uniref:Kelch repeat protein n=1 Tax=Adineta ricciae TaxID=249248 RepID=A0A815HZD0_ADIRI|nr:unnamed protein product [Adineta ricciae]CAF1494313.1 unnamed protein product [Adineta ricciae]